MEIKTENNRLVKTDMTLSEVKSIEEKTGTISNDEDKEYKGGNVDGN